jgi:hypothetical protein
VGQSLLLHLLSQDKLVTPKKEDLAKTVILKLPTSSAQTKISSLPKAIKNSSFPKILNQEGNQVMPNNNFKMLI